MAAEFSFDVVSEYEGAELTNALDQARREVSTRFDFKGTDPTIERKGDVIVVEASTEDRARAAVQVLVEKAARRNLSAKLFKPSEPKTVGKGRGQVEMTLNSGISEELAKIGRASCRERVEIAGVGGSVKKTREGVE